MKKRITLIIVIFSASYFYLNLDESSKKLKVEDSSNTLKIDKSSVKIKKINSHFFIKRDILTLTNSNINKNVSKTFWNSIIDFNLSKKDLINKHNPSQTYTQSKKIINQISKCIKEHCGIKADRDGHFNPELTAGNHLLKRSLELLKLIQEEGNLLSFDTAGLDFEKILESQNQDVKLLALELMLSTDNSLENLEDALALEDKFTLESKGSFYSKVFSIATQIEGQREIVLDKLKSVIINGDGAEAVSVLQNLPKELSQDELIEIVKDNCSLKSNPQFWNILSVEVNERNREVQPEILCD